MIEIDRSHVTGKQLDTKKINMTCFMFCNVLKFLKLLREVHNYYKSSSL